MKKSNIILLGLFVSLYIIPVLVFGINKMNSAGDYFTGFGEDYQTIIIENPGLKKEDIIINIEPVSESSMNMFSIEGRKIGKHASYLYYKENKKFFPEVSTNNNTLVVGKPVDAPIDAKPKLHIQISSITKIILNNETIWKK